jgi:hypothetical protein
MYMKSTVIALIIAFLIAPLQPVHSATNANAELIQKLLAQIVILQAELNKLIAAKGGSTSTTPCTFTRTLREGTQGTDVTCLQTYLKKKGHFTGNATGFYGPLTKDAVYKWQKSVGIVPEPTAIGMFGPRSQETLIREMKTTAPVATTNTPNTTNTTPKTTRDGGNTSTKEKTSTPTSPRTTPSTPTNGNTTPTTPVVVPPRTTPTPAVVNPLVLIDFGGTASGNSFGLSGWSTPLKDRYTDYQALGPGGTTIVTSDTAGYNFQGVSGTARTFSVGEKIIVTWYNNSTQSVTFTPKISLNDPDRLSTGVAGDWSAMSQVTIPASGTGSSEFSITSGNTGTYTLVNINVNFKNNRVVVADKIVLYPQGATTVTVSTPASVPSSVPASIPGDTTPPSVTAQNATQNLSAGTRSATLSVTTNENATCKYGTSPNTAYGSLPTTFTTTGGTSHSVSVSGLTDGSTKKFYVRCSDGSNNVTVSDTTFTVNVANPVSSACDATNRGTTRSIGDAYGTWENRPQWYFGNRVNNVADINAEAARNYGFDGLPYHEIDPVEQATILHFKNTEMALPLGAQIRFAFPPIGPSTTPIATFSWEAKFDPRGTNGGKAFQLASRNRIHIEFNPIPVTSEGSTWVTAPGTRTYGSTFVGGNGYGEQLSSGSLTNRNIQPALNAIVRNTSYCYNRDHVTGTNPRAFLVKPGQWYRFTYTLDWSSTPHRLSLWAESEDTPLTLLLADDTDSSKGFPVEFDPASTPIDQFYFEFNNSSTLNTTDFDIKVRNFFVLKDVAGSAIGSPSASLTKPSRTTLTNTSMQTTLLDLLSQLHALQVELNKLKH